MSGRVTFLVMWVTTCAPAAAELLPPPTTRPADVPAENRTLRAAPLPPAEVSVAVRAMPHLATPEPKRVAAEAHPSPAPSASKAPRLPAGARLTPARHGTSPIRFPSTSLRPRQASIMPVAAATAPAGPAVEFPKVQTIARDAAADPSTLAAAEPLPPPALSDEVEPARRPDLPARPRP